MSINYALTTRNISRINRETTAFRYLGVNENFHLGDYLANASILGGAVVTAKAADLNAAASSQTSIVLATPGAHTQVATVTLKDGAGTVQAAVAKCRFYMCTDSAGATPSSAGANVGVTIGGGGTTLKVNTAKLDIDVIVGATGIFTITFDNTGGSTYTDRIAVILPNGRVVVSAALAVPT